MAQVTLALERILYLLIHYMKSEETKFYELYTQSASLLDHEQLVEWISTKIRFLKEILRETLVKLLQHSCLFKETTLKGFLYLFKIIVLSFLCHKWNVKVSIFPETCSIRMIYKRSNCEYFDISVSRIPKERD
jgi:hypothetical protein